MGTFSAVTFVWVGALAAKALDRDCISLLERSARRARHRRAHQVDASFDRHTRTPIDEGGAFTAETNRGNATLSHRSVPGISTRMCDIFQKWANVGQDNHQQHRHRMLQDASCPMDLLQSVQDDADGFLALNEYSVFFMNRYYRRCDVKEIEIDPSSGVTISQIETFNSLSCLICFGDMESPVSSLPDCCLAKNARIPLSNPIASTFERICNEARATAIDDCGHVAVIETPPPRPGPQPPQIAPQSLVRPPPTSPATAPQLQPVDQKCIRGLVEADTQPSDGLLGRNEFTDFLENQYGGTCISNLSSDLRDGVFLQLACAWCLSGSGASLDCCSGSAARISIAEALDTSHQSSSSTWLQRVCSTVMLEIGQACEKKSGPIPTHVPAVEPVQPQAAPAIVQPVSLAPVRVSSVPSYLTTQPATGSLEEPTFIPIPTPDPTLRPPPGDESTAVPVQAIETTSAPVGGGGGGDTNAPTQSTTLGPSAAEPPVPVPAPDESPPQGPQSGSFVRVLYVFIWVTMLFSALCC
jgi:hypothetical protein